MRTPSPIRRGLALLATLTFLGCATPPATQTVNTVPEPVVHYDVDKPSLDAFLFFAVRSGLEADQMALPLARDIADEARGPMWVPKCPVCRPVERAFRAYLNETEEPAPSRIPEALAADLASGDRDARHEAMRELIRGYVQDAFLRLEMSPEERQDMSQRIEDGRKDGMSGKSDNFGPFCPSCDGAANIL